MVQTLKKAFTDNRGASIAAVATVSILAIIGLGAAIRGRKDTPSEAN